MAVTSVDIDTEILRLAKSSLGVRTNREAINLALRAAVIGPAIETLVMAAAISLVFKPVLRREIYVILAGVQMQPMRVLAKSGVHKRREQIAVYRSMERAVAAAMEKSRMGGVGGETSSEKILAG